MPSDSQRLRVLMPDQLLYFDTLVDELRGHGVDVVQASEDDRERIDALLPDVDIIVSLPRFGVTSEMIQRAPRLRAVNSIVIGTDTIDVDACTEAGIIIGNGAVPENYLGMAEGAVMLIVALLKDMRRKEAAMRAGQFRPAVMKARLVRGKTVGLIGLGRIGRGVVERLQGWEVSIVAHDPFLPADARVPGVELVGLDELLRRSDVVSIHTPMTKQTRGLLGARELALMQPTAYLVNTARGGIVEEQALADALNAGQIAGAAIDVFTEEPAPPSNPLWTVDPERIMLTGHNIGHGLEQQPKFVEAAVQNILREAEGELPLYVVNPEAEPRWRDRLARITNR
jgi:D-3-phosphoglycerate dehydrogenase